MADDMEQQRAQTVTPSASAPGLARNAGLLALGSAVGRVLGLVREMVIAAFFGATGEVSAFRVASQVPVLLYDFLVGGMLSAALVPVLSQYARLRSRNEFAYLVGVLATVLGLLLALVVGLLELTAPQVAWLLAAGFDNYDPELLELTTQLIRWTTPAVWLLGMAGLATAILYALQRFSFPALATAVYNLGIVIAAPLLARQLGILSLVVGILAGAGAQLAIMGIDLHRAGVRVRLRFDFRHPALAQIVRLYLPIALGLVVSLFQVGLDRRLASATGAPSIAWMANATTVQQMPLGLISVAISLAALPQLSRHFAQGDEAAYRATLGRGMRMVLLLIVPAAGLLWVLGTPVTRLLFERARFTPDDTAQVVAALHIYLVGMVFAAVDYPLNFAFYARSNTWLPALVGVISVGVYVVVAFMLLEPLGFRGLVWADTAKQAGHALLMGVMVTYVTGARRAGLGSGVVWIVAAGGVLTGVTWGVLAALEALLWTNVSAPSFVRDAFDVVVAGGLGVLAYAWVLHRARTPELAMLVDGLGRRLGRGGN